MKKVFVTIGFIIIIAGALVFYNKLYYPSLPIETISKREVLEKLNTSDQPIVFLSKENDQEWYIVNERNQSASDEIIKEMVSQSGWAFTDKDGSGLFFEKQGERLIVTTQKWTGEYVLVDIPTNWKE
ncbi:hypothetical protein H9636_04760 [Ureibacillus sp. Re31]|uniref:DUF4340 domain-containing protein n=1 Tax=Ureibacillus galli TaxID=2762222 RepID=A0ABR8X9F8_9BACL|nr:hypothetical protein [Ureibacillus galli]MBD8025964.1 hypothetical protein [Ureibacillus galli]